MAYKGLLWLVPVAAIATGVAIWITAPRPYDAAARFEEVSGDPAAGERVYLASGCASCHQAPDSEEMTRLAGGQAFVSAFGTFYAPNISTHPEAGIGAWDLETFANAVLAGVSPEGRHYYPAFPYTAYRLMTESDLADLWAYMQTLPEDATPSRAHEVGFPFNIRRGIGVWKRLYLDDDFVHDVPPDLERGRYLSEALAHCGECHTPRSALGGLRTERWMAGAPNPAGEGRIPPLTPDAFDWSADDIAYYLETGFTPDYDSAGGSMSAVISSFAKLPAEDRAAVAAYVKSLEAP